eukprot:PITA_02019
MASCEFALPVIDLDHLLHSWKSGGGSDELQELNKMREACSQLGFFRVMNHGIEPALIQTLDSVARDMSALPTEMKERAIFPLYSTGYSPSKIDLLGKDESMPESMSFPSGHIVDEICSKLVPQGNHKSLETIQKYMAEISGPSHKMLKLIMYSLGLDVGKHYESSAFDGKLRFNFYHKLAEGAPDHKEIFYRAHTDLSFFTILYEDDVGGLQIRTEEGNWYDSKPLPGSFVVNIGDSLQMWSNGRYRSSEHRVVHGGSQRSRLSIAFFLFFTEDTEILAPQELISEEHPQLYRAVTTKDLRVLGKKVGPSLRGDIAYFRL